MLAGRGLCALVGLIVCTFLAGCGSSSQSSSTATTSASSSTAAQTTTTTTTSPAATTSTTTSGGEVSGELDTLPQGAPANGTLPSAPSSATPAVERSYLTAVFNDAQRFWQHEFSEAGVQYAPARLVLFASATHSGCGPAEDTGPFYCGADHTVYLDVSFFELLARQAGVGRFGQAYIVGHELGHHVQFLSGISHRVAALNQQNPSGEKARSVRVELQADCLAGVWAHSTQTRGELTDADMNDALKTAAIVGDDFQHRAAGQVPDSAMFTHGTSAQRQQWLTTGFQSGRPGSCDTFASTGA